MNKIKIKKNDAIVVISGKDRGKRGKILNVHAGKNRVLVEDVGLKKKNQRPRKSGQKGEIITVPSSIHISNVMLYCSHCGKGARAGFKALQEDSHKVRICKKCKNII
ncbi:MAG: 50S ribosomal protein L24 [Patescibacteria group bacterium]